jgi:hypothetical protein
MTPEQIISSIRQKTNVVILLTNAGDDLSARAQQTLSSQEGRLRARGFQIYTLEISPRSSSSEELACVRAPQLRFFLKGKLQAKLIGIFDEPDIDSVLRSLF